jgi:aspartyl-tRNA(Asn)/glutamyl-tRNA(Gln) amidotransferase subunit A
VIDDPDSESLSRMTPSQARQRIAASRDYNAFISLTDEDGDGPVVGVKDLIDVRGTVTTAGGIILPAVPADRDAPVIRRIRQYGCVVVGKTNLHQWGIGVTSNNPHYGPVRNPHDPERVAGGSSGGSAAAVALDLCDWAIGSDTNGSIRIPAAFCGVVGFKPTVGIVDTEQVIPLSRTLDTLGPLARDVRGAAWALEMMSGLGPLVPDEIPPLASLRIAVPEGWGEDLDGRSGAVWTRVSQALPRIPFPERRRMIDVARVIGLTEAAAYHRRWLEDCPDRYGENIQPFLEALPAARDRYVAALLDQSRLRAEVEQATEGWDAILAPATQVGAPRIGESVDAYAIASYTRPFSTTGQPVVVMPAPLSRGELPVGIQVAGHFGCDSALVQVALAIETAWQEGLLTVGSAAARRAGR